MITKKNKKKNISITISENKLKKVKLYGTNKSRFIEKSLDYYIEKIEEENLKKAYIEEKEDNKKFAEESILIFENNKYD